MSMKISAAEPVALATALQTVILSLFACLTAFEVWTPTDGQTAALTAFYAAFVVLLGVWQRNRVTPVGKTK